MRPVDRRTIPTACPEWRPATLTPGALDPRVSCGAVRGNLLVEYHAALSALDWWETAGVDVLVGEDPRDWLAAPRRAGDPAPAAEPVAPAPAALPETLEAFQAWWLASPALPGPAGGRVAPTGDPTSGWMVMVECPDVEDAAAGRLLSGKAAGLFDAMLAAIGRSRETIYLTAFWPSRAAAGGADKAVTAQLAEVARHHIALARPKRLLLLGKAPVHGLTGQDVAAARGRLHDVGGVPAVASFLPSTLLRDATFKPHAWADLLRFTGDL